MRLRYCLTRLFFLIMGLRVGKWSRHVADLWSLGPGERNREQEKILRNNKPINAAGKKVASLSELMASPTLTKARLREKKKQSSGFKRRTSGTTGDPIDITLSTEELSVMLGVRDYCFRHYGVRVGDREARFWGRADYGWKSNLKSFVLNRKICVPSGEGAVDSVIRTLKWRPDYLYGYSSLLMEAAVIIETKCIRFKPPKCVICTAETILPAQKEYLKKIFNAPVAEEYGASEFDVIAFECRSGHRHLVNPWHVLMEKSGSLLVSDISRKTTDLINYDLGDCGAIKTSSCHKLGSADFLSDLTGRSINQFFYIDEITKLHVVELAYAINEFQKIQDNVFRFLIVQSRYGELNFYVTEEPNSGVDSLKTFLEERFLKRTGYSISIDVSVDGDKFIRSEKSYFVQEIKNVDSILAD